jgi:hypothetical protein
MQIDRSRFLLLASAMASGACASTPPATAPAPLPSAASASATAAAETTQRPRYTQPRYPGGEGYQPGPDYEGGGGPAPRPKAQRAFNRAQCSGDDVGAPAACSTLKEDASCAPFDFVRDSCANDLSYLKPRIAERAIGCMRAAGPKKLCEVMPIYGCLDDALRSACADPAADATCAAIVQKCAVPLDECTGYLSGMNDAGRAAVAKCLSNTASCGYGVWSCIEGL